MKRLSTIVLLFIMLAAMLPASVTAAPATHSYLLSAISDSSLPAGLEAGVAKAGGTVTSKIPQIGIAVASSSDPAFKSKAAKISGIRSVVPDIVIQWINPDQKTFSEEEIGYPPYSGFESRFYNIEWGMTAVKAPDAWNLGYMGAGVRVAVLDSGIDADNPDISPNLNTELSTSFVPGEGYHVHDGSNFFNHGTHVAGTIAAAINGWGVIGVAPQAEIVMVKVLSEYSGSGSWDGVIAGIVYAADIQADVINMSLGGLLQRRGFCDTTGECTTARDVTELVNAMNRATSYANQHGVTIIASAGNDGLDFDHSADFIDMPAQAVNVLTVSATAPIGWAKDPLNTFLDNPASYSNFGLSAIDLSAPGGDGAYPGNDVCTVATTPPTTQVCYVFDFVMSDGPCNTTTGSCAFYWAAGTSMASPHVSGVAALIIGKNGGSMNPAQVWAKLSASADDLGKPGKDAYYGDGRVNAYNAVK